MFKKCKFHAIEKPINVKSSQNFMIIVTINTNHVTEKDVYYLDDTIVTGNTITSNINFLKIIACSTPIVFKNGRVIDLPKIPSLMIGSYLDSLYKNFDITDIEVLYNDPVCQCNNLIDTLTCKYSAGDECNKPNPKNDFYGLLPSTNSEGELLIKNINIFET